MSNEHLLIAAYTNNLELAKANLKTGADVNGLFPDGLTALMQAALGGHTKLCELFIKEGADVNISAEGEGDINGFTALMGACAAGHIEIVKLLLEKKPLSPSDVLEIPNFFEGRERANINATDHQGFSALIMASFFGYTEIVKMLIDAGADVNAETKTKHTALTLTLERHEDHKSLVELLKSASAK